MASQIGIKFVTLLLLVQILAVKVDDVQAQSSCPMALTSLSPCLTYSSSGNSSSTPSSVCCSELAKLAQSAPSCICEALNIGGAQVVGFILGRTLPRSLPGACNLEMPSLNDCNNGGLGLDPNNTQNPGGDGEYSNATLSKMPLPVAIFIALLTLYAIVYALYV